MASPQARFQMFPRVVNGGIAGIVGVTCVFPIDLVKTRMQNQIIAADGELAYRNMFDCAMKTFRNEGFLGMYRGSAVNLLLITPEKAIKLVGNDFFRHHLRTERGSLPLSREMLAGAGAGMCQIIITTPMELLKIQLQDAGRSASSVCDSQSKGSSIISNAPEKKISATNIALRLVKEKGLLGLYKGCGATLLRDVTFSAIYFPLFAHFNSVGKRREGSDQAVFYVSFMAGCAAGSVASFSVNPFDVVKTRLQTIVKAPTDMEYSGIIDCFRKTLKHEGVTAFFKGAACRMMVIAPLFGIAQTVYYLGVAEWMFGLPKLQLK